MKRMILLASLAIGLAACNDSKNKNQVESIDNTAVETDSNLKNDTSMNEMQQAMDQMMDRMHKTKITGDADYDFANLMKLHHESAVQMAQVLVNETANDDVKQHAQNTIKEQQAEIDAFEKFLQDHQPKVSSDYGQKAMANMTMDAATDMSTLEKMYASMMIPHHQDGVDMAKQYLPHAVNEQLKTIANNIIRTQPKEIEDYKRWLSQNN